MELSIFHFCIAIFMLLHIGFCLLGLHLCLSLYLLLLMPPDTRILRPDRVVRVMRAQLECNGAENGRWMSE